MVKQTDIISKISKYKGAIFDLDGTLVNLNVDWPKLKQKLTKYCHSKKGINIEFTPLDQKLLYIKDSLGEDSYLALLKIISSFEAKETNYKFNRELINYINSATQQKIAVYSMNTKKCIDNIFKKYFQRKPDIVISKENCSGLKPKEKDILRIINRWNFKKEDVVFIGNSKSDLISGKKAGVATYIIEI